MKNNYIIERGMCAIALRRGGKNGTEFIYTFIDPADFYRVNEYKGTWTPKWNPTAGTFYARANDPKVGYLHRWILRITDLAIQVDHDDHNGLNNRRDNLFPTTAMGNGFHRRGPQINGRSQRRNVYWNERERKWMVWLVHYGKRYYAGYFSKVEDADEAAKRLRIAVSSSAELT
jgi:hypothetical protein